MLKIEKNLLRVTKILNGLVIPKNATIEMIAIDLQPVEEKITMTIISLCEYNENNYILCEGNENSLVKRNENLLRQYRTSFF